MDKIYKKINLEQAINRTPNELPFYYMDGTTGKTENSWGKYCSDIGIPTDYAEILSALSATTCVIKSHALYKCRYKNLMLLYYWIDKTLLPSFEIYILCKTNFEKVEITSMRDFLSGNTISDENIFENIPNVDGRFNNGDYIAVTPLYNEFRKKLINKNNIFEYLDFIETKIISDDDSIEDFYIPYIDVDLFIGSDIEDFGVSTPYLPNWVAGKKYYLGDIVTYNNKIYRLIKLIKCENQFDLLPMTDEYYRDSTYRKSSGTTYSKVTDLNNIPVPAFQIGRTEYFYVNGLTNYFIRPYYIGNYNNNLNIYEFDDGNYSHWTELTSETKTVSISGLTESKLSAFLRQKVTVDDSGNTLPFILSGDTAQTKYLLGITNEHQDNDGVYYGDVLSSVTFTTGNSTTTMSFQSGDSKPITVNYPNGISGTTKFEYYLGAEINISEHKVLSKPIKYEETWNFQMKQNTYRIDGTDKTYTYVDLYPSNEYEIDINNVDINGKKPILSKVTYTATTNTVCQIPTFRYEDMIGIQDSDSNIDAFIERGTGAALERLNILGEVKSMDDLVNYRNNFFKI